jgi:hypothetical protein
MTTERETLHAIGLWMEEGRTRLPDHVLDAALDQLPATPQRQPGWPARRIADMTALAKFEIAAAAVLVVVTIIGLNLLRSPGASELANAPPAAVVSPSPSTALSTGLPPAPESGPVDPGRYQLPLPRGGLMTFVVPAGWIANAPRIVKNDNTPTEMVLAAYLPGSRYEVTDVYADACRSAGQMDPVGPTVDDLVAVLDAQKGTDVGTTTFSTGSAVGRRIEIRETPGLDRSECRYGPRGPLPIWANEIGASRFTLAPGGFWAVAYAFDVDGSRLVIAATFGPEATDEDVAEVDAIVQSFEFSPH